MSNVECRMKSETRMAKKPEASIGGFRIWGFIILSSFVIRHSSFCRRDRIPHLAAVARAQFHRQTAFLPLRYAAAIDVELVFGDTRVAQHRGRKFAVLAVTPSAIHHDLFGELAQWQNSGQILFGMKMLELVGAGDVPLLIVLVVVVVEEHHKALLVARVMKSSI